MDQNKNNRKVIVISNNEAILTQSMNVARSLETGWESHINSIHSGWGSNTTSNINYDWRTNITSNEDSACTKLHP